MKLEIAVQDPAGALIARKAGADRVELCAALGSTGGLTPSAGTIERAVASGIGVHVLIRTRPGDFRYSPAEIETMLADTAIARSLGAAGVVIGAQRRDGELDELAMRAMIEAADGGEITCHRVFDVVPDRRATLERLVELGVTRILTSGGAPSVGQGLEELAALVEFAAGRIEIQAGGGLHLTDLPALASAGVDAAHLSARATAHTTAAGPGGGSAAIDVTDPDKVAAAVAAVRAVTPE